MTDLVSLEGRVIIVTGAAQGIGKAISELVIKLGGAVVALDLNGDALKTAVKSFSAARPASGASSMCGPIRSALASSKRR
jgi:3-oxoacyl-[acyl-carrier protein] reductase